MQHRRAVLCRLGRVAVGVAALGLFAAESMAQRPARPIARPPARPDRPLVPGRFPAGDAGGVPSGPRPGTFAVVAIDPRENTLRLRDDGGRVATVHVDPDLFDLESVKAGDQVEVDFLVPAAGSTKFEAGGVWKVQR